MYTRLGRHILGWRILLASPFVLYSMALLDFAARIIPHGWILPWVWLLGAPFADTPWPRRVLLRLGRSARVPRPDEATPIRVTLGHIRDRLTVPERQLHVLVVDSDQAWAETYGAHTLILTTGLLAAMNNPHHRDLASGHLAGVLECIDAAPRWAPFLDWAILPCVPVIAPMMAFTTTFYNTTPGGQFLIRLFGAGTIIGIWMAPSPITHHAWLFQTGATILVTMYFTWGPLGRWVDRQEKAAQRTAARACGFLAPEPPQRRPCQARFAL